MASGRRVRLPVVLAALAVAAAAAGCATAPSGGPPRRATGSGNQVHAYVQPLPPPAPTSSWPLADVVLGFLHASASYAFDPAAAEQYLAPALRKSWHPASGPVAVVGAPDVGPPAPYKPQIQGQTTPGQLLESVEVTGQRLATLSQTGQYQFTPGQTDKYQFILAKTDGTWLIHGLPPGLLLTQSDFEAVYQARNLFFYAPGTPDLGGVLVPDPVYAPLQSSNSALNTNLATRLVNGLLKDQGNWLSAGATWSAFPAGTHLIKQVTITGRVAQVDLGGGAVDATPTQRQLMEAQLRATLGDRSYSQPLANQVQLYINNALVSSGGRTLEASRVPSVSPGPILVVTGAGSSVGQLQANPRAGVSPTLRVSPVQIGQAQITAIAGQPTHGRAPQIAVAVADGNGCAVMLKANGTQSYTSYVLATSGGHCTSLSWDNNGNLWATAGQRVWVLRAQDRNPAAVDVTSLAAVGQPANKILTLRMAPDNVRAALLVQTKSGNKLLLAAVRFDHSVVSLGRPVSIGWPSDTDPIAVSWFDAYHLAALSRDGAILTVPLTGSTGLQPGGSPLPLGTAPGGAQTLTTDGSELLIGSGDGHVYASSLASPPDDWSLVATGSDPVYPG